MNAPSIGRQIVDGLIITGIFLNTLWVWKIHDTVAEKVNASVVVAESSCGERETFFKLLILKPDLDRAFAHELSTIIDEAARDFDRDPDFVVALMYVESRFKPDAVSSAGAHGLMQVMPLWLKVLGAEGDDLFDPRTNVRRGLQIYGSYESMLKSKEFALTAYNRGSWKVEEDLRQDKDPRNGYAKDVLDVYERLKQLL